MSEEFFIVSNEEPDWDAHRRGTRLRWLVCITVVAAALIVLAAGAVAARADDTPRPAGFTSPVGAAAGRAPAGVPKPGGSRSAHRRPATPPPTTVDASRIRR